MYVDRDSVGGACDDARTALQAAAITTPWCSLERAIAAAPSGGTVLVRRGSYPALAVASSMPAAVVTVQGYASEVPALNGLKVTNSTRLTFQGFRITDVTDLGGVSYLTLRGNDISPYDVRVSSGDNLLFEDNDVHDLTMQLGSTGHCVPPRCGYGFRVTSGVDFVTFRGNRFRRIPADAIQAGSVIGHTIEDNTFTDISAFVDTTEHSDAIQYYRDSQDLVLRRNVFRNTRGPLLGDPSGGTQNNPTIENNVFVNQRDWGLKLLNARNGRLVNNTVWSAGLGVVLAETTGLVAVNNVFEKLSAQPSMFAVEDYNLIGSGLRGGANDLGGTPRFADTAAGDFRLLPGGPGIDAGTSDHTAPVRDSVGSARVDTANIANTGGGTSPFYDMGAYEFTGTSPPPPPPGGGSYGEALMGTAGLLSYWRLGERSGTVATDAKGGRHGTYVNGAVLGAAGALAGDADTAVQLDGTNDSVTLPALPSSVDFTVEGWQRISAPKTTNNTLYGKAGTLRFIPRPSGFYVGVWLGGVEYTLQGSTASNVDSYVHWAVVRSGATVTVFRNGVQVGTRAGLPAATAASLTGEIGRTSTMYATSGRIDEVAVYDRALPSSTLQSHYDLGRG